MRLSASARRDRHRYGDPHRPAALSSAITRSRSECARGCRSRPSGIRLAELGLGDAAAAIRSFRRALYLDPSFGLAAFELGRAHDALGDHKAGRRSYEQALRPLDPEDDRHRVILDQVDLADVVAACRARLEPGPQ